MKIKSSVCKSEHILPSFQKRRDLRNGDATRRLSHVSVKIIGRIREDRKKKKRCQENACNALNGNDILRKPSPTTNLGILFDSEKVRELNSALVRVRETVSIV